MKLESTAILEAKAHMKLDNSQSKFIHDISSDMKEDHI